MSRMAIVPSQGVEGSFYQELKGAFINGGITEKKRLSIGSQIKGADIEIKRKVPSSGRPYRIYRRKNSSLTF